MKISQIQDVEKAIRSLKSAYLVCDMQFNLLASSDSFNYLFNSQVSELEGKNLFDLIDLNKHAECIKALRQTAVDGLPREIIEPGLTSNYLMKCDISRVEDVLLIEGTNVTNFQEEAETSNLRLREILKNLNVWIVVLDESTGIAELIFPDGTHIFQEQFIEKLSPGKQELIQNGIAELYENSFATIVAPDESGQRIIRTSISFASDGPKGQRKILSINSDVTEKIQYEEILSRKEQIAQIQKFAQGIAHDFGNISQTMRGFAELLVNVVEGDYGQKILENLLISTNRALKVSKKISEIARIQILENSNFNLIEFLIENLASFQNLLKPEIQLTLHSMDSFDGQYGEVHANSAQLERIVENIIENANQAISGPGKIDIYCYPNTEGSHLMLRIRNNGPAIPRKIADRIFMPFVTNGKDGGTGLGLYLAFEYLSNCGGSIHLENQNHNVSFIIALPFDSKLKVSDVS